MAVTKSNYAIALAVTAVVIVSAIGIGFAHEYSGTTTSSSQTVAVHHMVVELDGNGSGRLSDAFQFTSAASKPNFYADIVVGDSGSNTNYRALATESLSNPVVFEITAANTDKCTLSAQLTEVTEGMIVTLLFYSDPSCSDTPTEKKLITSEEVELGSFDCNVEYGCIAKIDLSRHDYGSEKPTSLSFSITFTATAELQEA